MRDSQLRAKLGVAPKPHCRHMTIIRGATTLLKLALDNKVYSFDDIKQVSFMFRQGSTIEKFTAIDYAGEDWAFDPHFTYDQIANTVNFTLSSSETATLFEPSNLHDLQVEFEIAIELNAEVENLAGAVIIEKQLPLYVLDSMYSQASDAEITTTKTSVVSDTLTCSNDLYCNN